MISLMCLATVARADIISDAEEVMNDGQTVFPQFFPTPQTTQTLPPWLFRYYPETGIYLGVNQDNAGVYVMGGVFSNEPNFVGSIDDVKALLENEKQQPVNDQAACNLDKIPDGIKVSVDGKNVSVSTEGQCIKVSTNDSLCEAVPDTDEAGNPIATGIHMLTTTDIQQFATSGITYSNPQFEGFVNGILQQGIGSKMCIINAPRDYAYSVNFDMCLDVTDQITDELTTIATVNPPVTMTYIGSSTSQVVADCYATDANMVVDLVTQETSVKFPDGSWQSLSTLDLQ